MVGSKLISVLNSLSNNELNAFEKYLLSPYFNENSDLVKLFEILTEQMRRQAAGQVEMEKREIWRAIYNHQPYKDIQLRRLTSELTKKALEFLGLEACRQQPFSSNLFMLESVNEPSLSRHFEGVSRQIKRISEMDSIQDPFYHFYLFKLEQNLHTHLEQSDKKIRSFEHLEQSDFQLDCFYFAQKLKNYCDILGYQKSLSAAAQIHLFPGFLAYLAEKGYLQVPVIRMYYLIANMLLNPDEEHHFFDLKEIMQRQSNLFLPEELKYLFIHAMNYCIDTKINIGRSEYFHELFAVYQIALEDRIIFEKDLLTVNHYKNIITVAMHVGAFEWVEQFIQNYTTYLPKDHQTNALNYNLAKVYFHQHKYDQVIEQLREVEYKNLAYALGSKLLLLKTYYELEEWVAMDSLMDSFRIYLRRNRLLSREVKQQYMNVLRFVKKLSKVDPFDREGLEKLRQQIDECKALADKVWIQEKLAAFQVA